MVDAATSAALGAGAAQAIEKTSAKLVERVTEKISKKYNEIQFSLSKGLPNYLSGNYAKCDTIKTLLNRNSPIKLRDCFVAPRFLLSGAKVESHEILKAAANGENKILVTGLAGSGKSVFLKHSFREVIENGYSYYPIFFELRLLNSAQNKKGMLLSAVFESIRSFCGDFARPQFEYGLKTGGFYFLFDGFDELAPSVRSQVADDICSLALEKFKCPIIVTSRPSEEFISWDGFEEAKLLPFDMAQSVEYVQKLNFDEERKQEFISDLRGGLFQRNKGFLSNPLLTAMMLLTYDMFGEIPEKRHIFYSKCFDVLAIEHDASKGRYKRELMSGLSVDKLERVFMFFCTFSYYDRCISFNRDEMEKYTRQSIEACSYNAEIDLVIHDFREAISIMELDGVQYEFAHRSFQEYFYAKFVVTDREVSLKEKISWLFDHFFSDDTVSMIADMDRTYFEVEYLIPELRLLNRRLQAIDAMKSPSSVLGKFYSSVSVHEFDDVEAGAQHSGGKTKSISFTIEHSRNQFLWSHLFSKYKTEKIKEITEELISKERREEISNRIEAVYGGRIKIHHTNNDKLIDVGCDLYAERMKRSLSVFLSDLEAVQKKRKNGLGELVRGKYLRRKK